MGSITHCVSERRRLRSSLHPQSSPPPSVRRAAKVTPRRRRSCLMNQMRRFVGGCLDLQQKTHLYPVTASEINRKHVNPRTDVVRKKPKSPLKCTPTGRKVRSEIPCFGREFIFSLSQMGQRKNSGIVTFAGTPRVFSPFRMISICLMLGHPYRR